MRRTLLALALSLAAASVAAHDDQHRDIDRVNGGVTAEAGQTYGDLSTVNGGVSIEAGAIVDEAETVNGGITIADNAQLGSATTVNGGIHAGQHIVVKNDVETVNGGIRISFLSQVGGDVSTVNGGITIQQTEVNGRLNTVNGDITVGAKSHVRGGILVEKPNHGWNWSGKPRIPRIVIGPDAVVDGELRFEHEVELFVHTSAKVGTVTGATAKPYTDTLPARADGR
ncbi:hypothetical protein [Arenimonas oryziterrae]|uniref:Polymer-forming cytoskeletal protein n=1 Tax=Arenimonas oryziterrae DSM 21050 = YC6267 TaxID=1121015 RepID=A0A091AX74_9GAMM|nr:hypothetical protein [Arenimonas oryziterrae]KFN44026.1 hypothetical protein N789_06325 [Arenimonas oryziterrae DSM 21050 = YC6267]